MPVWRPRLNANWSCTLFLILKHWWTKPSLWKMRDAAWRISASGKGTRLTMLATTEAGQIFRKVGHTSLRQTSHAQPRISMQGTKSSHIAQALLAMLVEKKDTMPSSVPSQGTRPQRRTTVAIIQHPSETISTPITTTGARRILRKVGHTNPRQLFHAQSRISMQGTKNSHIAQALLATPVEKKDTMPSSAPS